MKNGITHPTWVNLDVYIVRKGREEKKNDKMVPVLKYLDSFQDKHNAINACKKHQ